MVATPTIGLAHPTVVPTNLDADLTGRLDAAPTEIGSVPSRPANGS